MVLKPTRSLLLTWTAAAWGKPVLWALCAAPAVWLMAAVWLDALGANPAEALIRSLGEWALRFLCLALLVTPARVVLGVPGLARWRRSMGVSVWCYGGLHLLAYAWLDMGFSLAEIWADVLQRPFILVGMLAMVLLTALAATSFNRVVRWMGSQRWQALHKAVYLVAVLAMIHFTWMRAGKNHYGEVWLYGAVLALLLAWRWRRWRQRRLV